MVLLRSILTNKQLVQQTEWDIEINSYMSRRIRRKDKNYTKENKKLPM